MTWNPLKKSHLTAKPTLAPQAVPKQQDRELEHIFIKLQRLEEANKKIQKEIKRYMEGLMSLSKAEYKLTSELSSSHMCYQDKPLRNMVEEYLSVTSKVGESVQEVTRICQKAVIDPLKKFGSEFSSIAGSIQKREQAVQELLRQETRLRKAEDKEKTASNVLKREQAKKAVQQAKEEVSSIHQRLLAELPKFYSSRCEHFRPCLEALIRAQVDYHGTTLRLFTQLANMSSSEAAATVPQPEPQYQARLQTRLQALRALNIVRAPSSSNTNTLPRPS